MRNKCWALRRRLPFRHRSLAGSRIWSDGGDVICLWNGISLLLFSHLNPAATWLKPDVYLHLPVMQEVQQVWSQSESQQPPWLFNRGEERILAPWPRLMEFGICAPLSRKLWVTRECKSSSMWLLLKGSNWETDYFPPIVTPAQLLQFAAISPIIFIWFSASVMVLKDFSIFWNRNIFHDQQK